MPKEANFNAWQTKCRRVVRLGLQWPNLGCPRSRELSAPQSPAKHALQREGFAIVGHALCPSEVCTHHFRTTTDPFQLDASTATQLTRRLMGIKA
jgi:hypothetical protein